MVYFHPGLVVCRTMGRFRRTEASSSLSGKPSEPASIPETVVPARKILDFSSRSGVHIQQMKNKTKQTHNILYRKYNYAIYNHTLSYNLYFILHLSRFNLFQCPKQLSLLLELKLVASDFSAKDSEATLGLAGAGSSKLIDDSPRSFASCAFATLSLRHNANP